MTTRLRKKMHRKGLHFRKINAFVEVGRVPTSKVSGTGFVACVKVGYGNVRKGNPTNLAACATGRNPRRAIANALIKAGRATQRRRGTFAGTR